MRAVKYYVACTVDGFIAHADGTWGGFLPEGEHVADFLESYKWFDVVLMGRKTYEIALKEGVTNPYPTMNFARFDQPRNKNVPYDQTSFALDRKKVLPVMKE